jgi:hypothetical protein
MAAHLSQHEASLAAIREKHGGALPSDLYNLTNAKLGKILFDLTAEKKYIDGGRISKEDLVETILRISKDAPVGQNESPVQGYADFDDPPQEVKDASAKERKDAIAEAAPSDKHEASLDAIRAKHSGELPSDLYHLTNATLGKILFDLTAEKKYIDGGRISKEHLVETILRISKDAPVGQDEGPVQGFADYVDPVETSPDSTKRTAATAEIEAPDAKKVAKTE